MAAFTVPFEWEYLGRGKERRTFYHRGYVVKVPVGGLHKTALGRAANREEARKYARSKRKGYKGPPLAPCRLLPNGWLVMRYVRSVWADPGKGTTRNYPAGHKYEGWPKFREMVRRKRAPGLRRGESMPRWARSIDVRQVGYLPSGKLVAYDYAA